MPLGAGPAGAAADRVAAQPSDAAATAPAASERYADANILLRLADPRLEALYWRQGSALWRLYDTASCIFGICLLAPFAVTLPGGAPGPREPGLAAVQAPHRALLLLSLLHLWLLLLAWPAYARRRVPVLLAMRGCRLLMHAWQTLVEPGTAHYWQAKLLAPDADPRRSMQVSMIVVPLAMLQHSLMHPAPMALLPLGLAASAWLYLAGWLPQAEGVWTDPRMAEAVRGYCAGAELPLLAVDSLAVAAYGAPLTGASALTLDAGPAPERCLRLVQTSTVSLMLLLGVAIPMAISWKVEHQSKARFLSARGLTLRVCPCGRAWLAARALAPPRGCTPPRAPVAAAAPLLLWQLSGLLLAARAAGWRLAGGGAWGWVVGADGRIVPPA